MTDVANPPVSETAPDTTPASGDNSRKKVPVYCYQCVAGPDLLKVEVENGVATRVESNFDITGVRKLETTVRPVYALTDARKRGPSTFTIVTPDSAHDFPDDIRGHAYDWLDKRLK